MPEGGCVCVSTGATVAEGGIEAQRWLRRVPEPLEAAEEATGMEKGQGGGGIRRCECDIEFAPPPPPGDVPVIDNVRPLDRKPFARSVTKFMKVSSARGYN